MHKGEGFWTGLWGVFQGLRVCGWGLGSRASGSKGVLGFRDFRASGLKG